MTTTTFTTTAGGATRIVVLLVLVSALAPQAVAQIEGRIGTWELNIAKSTFTPGPPPRQQTLTYVAAGPHWTALIQGIDASGKTINPDIGNLTITFDGRDHATPTMDYDTTAWKRVDDRKYLVIRKKAGKVVLTSTNVLSADGNTMTITTTGHNALGQAVSNIRVYDRRAP